jgi:hypothetical protein
MEKLIKIYIGIEFIEMFMESMVPIWKHVCLVLEEK